MWVIIRHVFRCKKSTISSSLASPLQPMEVRKALPVATGRSLSDILDVGDAADPDMTMAFVKSPWLAALTKW